eukprot:7376097-Prymnesium_polylepis.1
MARVEAEKRAALRQVARVEAEKQEALKQVARADAEKQAALKQLARAKTEGQPTPTAEEVEWEAGARRAVLALDSDLCGEAAGMIGLEMWRALLWHERLLYTNAYAGINNDHDALPPNIRKLVAKGLQEKVACQQAAAEAEAKRQAAEAGLKRKQQATFEARMQ